MKSKSTLDRAHKPVMAGKPIKNTPKKPSSSARATGKKPQK